MAVKTKRSKVKIQKSTSEPVNSNVIPGGKLNNFLNTFPDKVFQLRSSKYGIILVIVVILLAIAIYKKSWFVAATVNGMPITNLDLQMKLNQDFRTQTLTQMINEKIILDEAAKNGDIPTQQEINQKIADLEKQVGGKDALDSLLAQQGQTRTSLNEQIKVQLAITKLYKKEATVSADEVNQFIEQNKDQMKATDSAGQQKEATDAIQQQKLSQIFSQKFQTLKQKANVQIF